MNRIVTYPADVLDEPTEPCDPTSPLGLQVAGDLMVVLQDRPDAAAVAANQLGYAISMFAYRDEQDGPVVVANPVIAQLRGKRMGWERCLSFPGERFLVRRAQAIVLAGVDILGESIRKSFSEGSARMIQHEVDHLRGIVVSSRATHREAA